MTAGIDGDHVPTPHPVGERDVTVLIGWLAAVEGEIMAGLLPEPTIARLRRRFERAGLLSESSDDRAFRQAINDMNHRLHYALGEYADPPTPVRVPD